MATKVPALRTGYEDVPFIDLAEDYTPPSNGSVLARICRMAGSHNSVSIPSNHQVTGCRQQTSAAWEAEPRNLLLAPSSNIKGGPDACYLEIIKRHLSHSACTSFRTF